MMIRNKDHRRPSTSSQPNRRIRLGPRTQLACINCKERKLKCDEQVPTCSSCQRFDLACLVEDPATKRRQPRNYVETLERRVAFLEEILQDYRPELARDHFSHSGRAVGDHLDPTAQAQIDSHDSASPLITREAREQNEESDDLARRVGMLALNAAGDEPRYLGSSSSFAFSRAINSSLRQVVSKMINEAQDGKLETYTLPTTCDLPPYHIAIILSNAYFENIHPQYPFLHEPSFRIWEEAVIGSPYDAGTTTEPDFRSLYFVNMVYAVGALLMPELGCLPDRLYMTAQVYADYVLALDNVVAVQAILCCAIYSLRSSIGSNHWKLAGLALRQCIDLGYHRSSRHLKRIVTPFHAELCKRVFWCSFVMDCNAGRMLGRPLGIPYQVVDAEYPIDVDDIHIQETGISVKPRTSNLQQPTKMTKSIHAFRLRRLWAKIHTDLYSDTDVQESEGYSQKSQLQKLRAELEDWKASIPTTHSSTNEGRSLFASSSWYELNYNYTLLSLYRAQITNQKANPPDAVFFECLQASENICRGYRRQFVGRTTSYTWGALHELFLAGLTYVHCLWSSSVTRKQTRPDQVSSVCSDCTMVLVVMSERWPAAAPYRDIFEVMASRTVTMMIDQLSEASDNSASQYSVGNNDLVRLPDLIATIADDGNLGGFNDLISNFASDDFTSFSMDDLVQN